MIVEVYSCVCVSPDEWVECACVDEAGRINIVCIGNVCVAIEE